MATPHAAATRELLVRCLDAWTPTALHGHAHIVYVDALADRDVGTGPPAPVTGTTQETTHDDDPYDGGGCAETALRVFAEFNDRLAHRRLTIVLGGTDPDRLASLRTRLEALASELDLPDGLRIVTGAGLATLPRTLADAEATGVPTFGWFDAADPGIALEHLTAAVRAVTGPGCETMITSTAVATDRLLSILDDAGSGAHTRIELVDPEGVSETLIFAAPAAKSVEKFKNELWAIDEYAGIRLRDPADPDRAVVDISLPPHLGPLRRAIVAHLGDTGPIRVDALRTWASRATIYRGEDVVRAVAGLVASGQLAREPASGRLSATTTIMPASPAA